MNAEEYLVDRIQKLEKANAFLECRKEMLSKKNEEQNKTIIAIANILEEIMKESDLTVSDLDRHCDLGIAKLKITVMEHIYHGDLVCEILQEAYNNTHTVKDCGPLEPPTTDPKFYDICHRQAEILLKDKGEQK